MPRPFDPRENADIRDRLRDAGARLFRTKGVMKTTIDELARAAGIAKGSFYKFYDSKELLFFEILEEVHVSIRAPMLEAGGAGERNSRKVFEKRLRNVLVQSYEEPLIRFMANEEEFSAVVRRVPPERLLGHEQQDQIFLDQMIARWAESKPPPKRDVVAARLTAALLICMRRDFIGERLFPLALDAAIESISTCFFDSASARRKK